MPLLSASLDAFLFTSLTMIISYLYYASFFHPSAKPVPPSHMHALLNALVLLHTLYILHALTLKYPPNIFQALRLPLTTPTEHIRSALLRASNGKPLTDALENLLTRLGSYEVRTFYVRFGHDTVSSCEFCHTFSDHAIYALPTTLLQYVRTACLVGILTIRGSHKERWRTLAVTSLIFAALCEAWWVNLVVIGKRKDDAKPVSGPGITMWHDAFYALRHLLFLLLPLLIQHVLPAHPTAPPAAQTLGSLPSALEHTLRKAHLLKYARGAVMRDPELRTRSTAWWTRERVRGEALRTDEGVRAAARSVGWGFDDAAGGGAPERGAGWGVGGLVGMGGEGAGADAGNVRLRLVARRAARGLLRSLIPEETS